MLNVLDSQEAVYFGFVGWIFFSKKEKWQFPVFDTFNLETDFCPVILAVEHNLGGAKDGDVSV